MFCPVTSMPRRCAYSELSAPERPEKVLTSHRLVDQSVAGRGGNGLAVPAVGLDRAAHREQRLADRTLTHGEQVAVGLGEAADLRGERQERLAVLPEHV